MKRAPILIVDDARTTRTHLKFLLESMYECHTAASAEEGLELLRTLPNPPQLVLLDVQMPGMNGVECLATIKGSPDLSHTRVVMVTTRGEEAVLAECLRLGCDGYVTKPVQSGELFRVVQELMRQESQS